MRLQGKIAIVTGAGGGFGAGIAQRFIAEGASVALVDLRGDAAEAVAQSLGGKAIAIQADVGAAADVARVVKDTVDRLGPPDILVNNAGTTHRNKPILEVSEDEFDRMFRVNVKSIYLFVREIAPVMREHGGGVILNVGSTAGIRPRPGLTWYNATKGAVNLVSKSLGVELAPWKIRVNCISPVMGETGLLEHFMGVPDTPENRARFIATIPLGRMSRPSDIANAALFLASDEAEFITRRGFSSGWGAHDLMLRRVGSQRDILGESPIWAADEQALYWVDIRSPALRRLDGATQAVETRAMPDLVGAVALAGGGRLLVACAGEVSLYDWASARLETVARLPERPPGHRFNDGRCDRQGRFWVGTMHNDTRAAEGTLFRLDRAGLVPVLRGVRIPNSLGWSPDGRTMYFADSLGYAITAHAYDPATGAMSPGTELVRTVEPGFPDGSTIDAEGYLWNAEFNGGRLARYAPDGRLDRIVELPVGRPTSCGFGGPALATLYVTTTCQGMSEAEQQANPLAGALLAFEPGVAGLPEPVWSAP